MKVVMVYDYLPPDNRVLYRLQWTRRDINEYENYGFVSSRYEGITTGYSEIQRRIFESYDIWESK